MDVQPALQTVTLTPVPDAKRREIPELTGLRAVAAMGVFFTHVYATFTGTELSRTASMLGNAGATGVTLFFVLSGYLLAAPSTLASGAGTYAVRRLARIYPTYVFTLAITLALIAAASGFGKAIGWSVSPASVVFNALLLQSWHPAGMSYSIIYPAWSLSVECFFYLLLPFTISWFSQITKRWPATVFAVLVLMLAASGALVAEGATHTVFPRCSWPSSTSVRSWRFTAHAHRGRSWRLVRRSLSQRWRLGWQWASARSSTTS